MLYICNNKNQTTMSILKSILNMLFKTAVDSLNQKDERPAARAEQSFRPHSETVAPQPAAVADPIAYFAEIISSEFPQYSMKRDVPVTDLAGFISDESQLYKTRPVQTYKAEWGAPYTFVLYQGDKPAGIVMLGSGSSHHKNVKYLVARMFAKKMGLPYINFYTQMPNERAYVVKRIREFLNT